MLCTEIVSDIENNFCTQHEELLTKIYLYVFTIEQNSKKSHFQLALGFLFRNGKLVIEICMRKMSLSNSFLFNANHHLEIQNFCTQLPGTICCGDHFHPISLQTTNQKDYQSRINLQLRHSTYASHRLRGKLLEYCKRQLIAPGTRTRNTL